MLQGMRESRQIRPRVDANGRWKPPQEYGANRSADCPTNDHLYCFDGNRVVAIPDDQQEQFLGQLQDYRTMSVYHEGNNFWAAPVDAVEDGVATGDGGPDDENVDDWELVQFDYNPAVPGSYVSSLQCRGQWQRLWTQRPSQRWVKTLFPRPFSAETAYRTTDANAAYGGLIGNLNLIIALMALSRPREHILQTLQYCMDNGRWRGPNIGHSQIGEGCNNQRTLSQSHHADS